MKEHCRKNRSTKVVTGNFKQELLNRLRSSTAVKGLIIIFSVYFMYSTYQASLKQYMFLVLKKYIVLLNKGIAVM